MGTWKTPERRGRSLHSLAAASATLGLPFVLLLAAGILIPSPSEAWQAMLGAGEVWAVAVDPAGNAVAVGSMTNAQGSGDEFAVIKLSGSDGEGIWRSVIPGSTSGSDYATSVVLNSAGDVFAGGRIEEIPGALFTVTKFSGQLGKELWRSSPIVGTAYYLSLVGGSLYAAGTSREPGDFGQVVIRFDGATWRALHTPDHPGRFYQLAVWRKPHRRIPQQ